MNTTTVLIWLAIIAVQCIVLARYWSKRKAAAANPLAPVPIRVAGSRPNQVTELNLGYQTENFQFTDLRRFPNLVTLTHLHIVNDPESLFRP